MLTPSRRLSPTALTAVAELERRVTAADGGRLKLEWGTLRARSGDRVEDFLWWDDDRLLGFAGLYRIGGEVEATGMVDPDARGRGIGSALLGAVLDGASAPAVLLVVPRGSAAGASLALRRGGVPHHSEHALQLRGEPAPGPTDPRVTVRPATPGDVGTVTGILTDAFGDPGPGPADHLERTLVIEHDGAPVGTVRVDHEDDRVGVYGFAVARPYQGRGIGRQVLREVCRRALAAGATTVELDVAVGNDRALGLYTSLGFRPVHTEDYYSVPTS